MFILSKMKNNQRTINNSLMHWLSNFHWINAPFPFEKLIFPYDHKKKYLTKLYPMAFKIYSTMQNEQKRRDKRKKKYTDENLLSSKKCCHATPSCKTGWLLWDFLFFCFFSSLCFVLNIFLSFAFYYVMQLFIFGIIYEYTLNRLDRFNA